MSFHSTRSNIFLVACFVIAKELLFSVFAGHGTDKLKL